MSNGCAGGMLCTQTRNQPRELTALAGKPGTDRPPSPFDLPPAAGSVLIMLREPLEEEMLCAEQGDWVAGAEDDLSLSLHHRIRSIRFSKLKMIL